MFGNPLYIVLDGFGVTLRPPKSKEEAKTFTIGFSSLEVLWWVSATFATTPEREEDWYVRTSDSIDTVAWVIVPDGADVPIGVTSLSRLDLIHRSCVSGIVVTDRHWWRRGVAYRAHLIRTWYASQVLNMATIQSYVRDANPGSYKALEKVGYVFCGLQLRNCFRDGKYYDTRTYSWLNPNHISILYPKGAPTKYKKSLRRAKEALEIAGVNIKKI